MKTKDRLEQISGILKEIESIRVSGTREDLEQFFVPDGGITAPPEERYCYKDCRYVKIDVVLSGGEEATMHKVDGKDQVILKLSKPYLQTPYFD